MSTSLVKNNPKCVEALRPGFIRAVQERISRKRVGLKHKGKTHLDNPVGSCQIRGLSASRGPANTGCTAGTGCKETHLVDEHC